MDFCTSWKPQRLYTLIGMFTTTQRKVEMATSAIRLHLGQLQFFYSQ